MTRINLVDPGELHYKHLVAELHELPRVFTLARNAQYSLHKKEIPAEYTLGKGHVLFFYTRLGFLADRYELLCDEMRRRNYNVNQIPRSQLLAGISPRLCQGYTPTSKALEINRARIKERTNPAWQNPHLIN